MVKSRTLTALGCLAVALFLIWSGLWSVSPELIGSPMALAVAAVLTALVAFQHRLGSAGGGGFHLQVGQPFARGLPLALRTRAQLLLLSEQAKNLLEDLRHLGAVAMKGDGPTHRDPNRSLDWTALNQLAGHGFVRPLGRAPWPLDDTWMHINPFVALQVEWLVSRGLWPCHREAEGNSTDHRVG